MATKRVLHSGLVVVSGMDARGFQIRKRFSRKLRNAYISSEIMRGVPVELVGRQCGHHAVDMTRKYFVVDPARRRAIEAQSAKTDSDRSKF